MGQLYRQDVGTSDSHQARGTPEVLPQCCSLPNGAKYQEVINTCITWPADIKKVAGQGIAEEEIQAQRGKSGRGIHAQGC